MVPRSCVIVVALAALFQAIHSADVRGKILLPNQNEVLVSAHRLSISMQTHINSLRYGVPPSRTLHGQQSGCGRELTIRPCKDQL